MSNLMKEQIAVRVYVDTFPTKGAMNPKFDVDESRLLPWEELDEPDIRGMSDEHRNLLRQRAIPEPGGVIQEAPVLVNDRRLDVPSIVICTSYASDEIKSSINEGHQCMSGLAELHDVTFIDQPTHHRPMFSRPKELAFIIDDVARHVTTN